MTRICEAARAGLCRGAFVGLVWVILTSRLAAQPGAGQPPPAPFERLPDPGRPAETMAAPSSRSSLPPVAILAADGAQTCLIDLWSALRLAERANPDIGLSRQAIQESLALQLGARAMLLPSFNGGSTYHLHEGNLQRANGTILGLSLQSLYAGAGAQTVTAQTVAIPGMRIFGHLGDAYFEPLAARQQTSVRFFDAGATTNAVLLAVSTGYLELMAAEAQLDVLLRSQVDADAFVRIVRSFAEVGQGRRADANRTETEAALVDSQIQRAREQVAVAAAELARLLSLDPAVRLRTAGGPIPLVQLVDPNCRLDQLLEVALRQRPELAARAAQVLENETRYRQERARPLLPTVSVGFSVGTYGGGSNLTNPTFGNFAGRTDFDAVAYWTLQNVGVGNSARWRGRRAQTDEAVAARTRAVNLVRREVAEAYALSQANWQQVAVSVQRLAIAETGYREEFQRIRAGQGLPIELLDSLTRAITARQALVSTTAAYDQAQFRLFVALGTPPTRALQPGPELRSVRGE